MGTVIHRTAVIVALSERSALELVELANNLKLPVTTPARLPCNGYWAVTVLPSGSKEGWPDQKHHSAALGLFLAAAGIVGHEFAAVEFGRDLGKGKNVQSHFELWNAPK